MADLARAGNREAIDRAEAERLLRAEVLVPDARRVRPLYFDGRFLTAEDLTREQNYFLSRQADLGRAGGAGVVAGLEVTRGGGATRLRVAAGHGVTALGEPVILTSALEIDLADLPELQLLDRVFGLLRQPREPGRSLTGPYVLAARPVEYSARPIASYPTTLDGKRTVEDGEIVEATALSLFPFPEGGGADDPSARRGRIARQIFVEGRPLGAPPGALPLAVLFLTNNIVQWVDNFMVRREVGAEHGDVLGMGFAPRAAREALVLQYHAHLAEIAEQRTRAGAGLNFAAATYFQVLPPAGRLPKEVVNAQSFTQSYFPVGIDADLAVVPQDEVAALVEESLLLPPIDTTLPADELESTSVMIVIPVPRHLYRETAVRLTSRTVRLGSATPNLRASFKPLQALQVLANTANLTTVTLPGPDLEELAERAAVAAWQEALAGAAELWYVRRRNLHYDVDIVGATTPIE